MSIMIAQIPSFLSILSSWFLFRSGQSGCLSFFSGLRAPMPQEKGMKIARTLSKCLAMKSFFGLFALSYFF